MPPESVWQRPEGAALPPQGAANVWKGCPVCEEKVSLNVRAVYPSFRSGSCAAHSSTQASQAAFWLAVFSLSLPVFFTGGFFHLPACFWEGIFLSFSPEGVPLEARSAFGFRVASILAAAGLCLFAASAFFAVEVEGLAFAAAPRWAVLFCLRQMPVWQARRLPRGNPRRVK